MCQTLNLEYEILSKYDHKSFIVYNFHRFLNKSMTITTEKRGINNKFVLASIATGYDWNIVQIDDTDILRHIPAIDREHSFPIDINLKTLLNLTQK